ncbi:hypothetical protein FRC07_013370 [Ceratobasidium sp. 392]|nr:hypothetical protein FRC07_013370 [Ceratobasidium sp. 392]
MPANPVQLAVCARRLTFYLDNCDDTMAVVAPPPSSSLRRRALPAVTALLANEALDLINVPGANSSLAQQAQEWIASLKPRILQAPANNDQDAQEQVSRIEQYIQLVEAAANVISDLDVSHQDETTATFLLQLQEFHEYLDSTRTELQDLQDQRSMVKFARQVEIRSRLDEKQNEIWDQAILFCLGNGLLANHATARLQANLNRCLEIQNSSNERVRWLEYQTPPMFLSKPQNLKTKRPPFTTPENQKTKIYAPHSRVQELEHDPAPPASAVEKHTAYFGAVQLESQFEF